MVFNFFLYYYFCFFICWFKWLCIVSLCFKWHGVSFVFHIDPKSNFHQFRLSRSSDSVNVVWSIIWVGVVSELWKHRNFIIFKRGMADASEVFDLMQVKVWSWISVRICSALFSYSNWCLEPLVRMRMISWSFFFSGFILTSRAFVN